MEYKYGTASSSIHCPNLYISKLAQNTIDIVIDIELIKY